MTTATPVRASDLKLKERRKTLKYQPIFDAIDDLRVGMALTFKPPDGVPLGTFASRIDSALRYWQTKTGSTKAFSLHQTEDGELAIIRKRWSPD